MKKYFPLIKSYVSLFVGGYVFCCVIGLHYNPLKWGEVARLVFLAPILVSIFGNKNQ